MDQNYFYVCARNLTAPLQEHYGWALNIFLPRETKVGGMLDFVKHRRDVSEILTYSRKAKNFHKQLLHSFGLTLNIICISLTTI